MCILCRFRSYSREFQRSPRLDDSTTSPSGAAETVHPVERDCFLTGGVGLRNKLLATFLLAGRALPL